MKQIRQLPFLYRLFCGLMALQVINFSVDPPDSYVRATHYSTGKEDLSINEMESIGEWVLEVAFDQTDCIPEQDESDDAGKITRTLFCWVSPELFVLLLPAQLAGFTYQPRIHFLPVHYFPYFGEVSFPPPQQV